MLEPIALIARQSVETGAGSLKLSAFKALLETHRTKQFRLILPTEQAIPFSFHITEVAHVQKRFIDCGGKLHTVQTCQLQVWLGPDTDHRLLAGKMADVLNLAQKILPEGQDLDLEIEYEDTTLSQYPVVGATITEEAVVLKLTHKHTDCLAQELCVPSVLQAVEGATPCCGTGCNC